MAKSKQAAIRKPVFVDHPYVTVDHRRDLQAPGWLVMSASGVEVARCFSKREAEAIAIAINSGYQKAS